jgi:hypothetical protein
MSSFNSADFAWASLTVVLAGRPLVGIRGIQYKVSQEKELLHAAGNEPLGIQHGNKMYEGSIKLLKTEYDRLRATVAAQGLDMLSFTGDILVTYLRAGAQVASNDRIKSFEFKELDKALEQNAKYMEMTLPIIFLGVEENV